MKKLLSIFVFTLLTTILAAQVSKTVNVATAGTLTTLLTATEKTTVTNLTITGNIDARDVKCMRDEMNSLSVVDISSVLIKQYVGYDGTSSSLNTYPENEMPKKSFARQYAPSLTDKYLTKISLPNSITSIGDSAFYNCGRASWVSSAGMSGFCYFGLTGELIIPNTVKTIGNYAFWGTAYTGCLTIGSNVTLIGENAFTSFNIIKCLSTIPPVIVGISNLNPTIVYVPSTALQVYKTSANWSAYNIIAEKKANINVQTAGSLGSTLITGGYGPLPSLTHLNVTGYINSSDISLMKSNMSLLTEIDLSGAILDNNTLPANAFQDKTTLTLVKLPSNLQIIGDYSFSGCSSLSNTIPLTESLTSIGRYSFAGCTNLSGSLIIPNSVIYIGDYAFQNCIGFSGNLSIGNSVSLIRDYAFYGCSGFNGCLILPALVKSIGNGAFKFCLSITGNLIIGDEVTSIGYEAFRGCRNFNGKLTIGNKVNSIGSYAFSYCQGFTGTLTLPSNISTISSNAFEVCVNLTQLILSKNTSFIYENAFYACSGLSKISIPKNNPPTIFANTFAYLNKGTCILEVPIGSSINYQLANYWGEFFLLSEKNFDLISDLELLSDKKIKVYSINSEIIIDGTSKGETVIIYTVTGKQIQTFMSKGERLNLSVDKNAVYLVKTREKTFKVIL